MTSSSKNTNRQEVSFLIDGQVIVKSITKYTTCADVINKFPKRDTPIAVFESIDGDEKELPAKTKLLKVCRAHGLSKQIQFVIRKSDLSSKVKKNSRKFFSIKPKCDKPKARVGAQGKNMSKETLKKVSDLAFYVRYQKTKLQSLNKKSTVQGSEQKKLMKRLSSKASVNSMDAFLAKTNLDEMARFLNFCGEVTAEKLGSVPSKNNSVTGRLSENNVKSVSSEDVTSRNLSTSGLTLGLKKTKFGLKQKFASKPKVVERTVSTGTISSTDTGYHSVGSVADKTESVSSNVELGSSKRHRTQLLASDASAPRHSTPVSHGRHQPRTSASCLNLSYHTPEHADNEQLGKSMILQKFMADQSTATALRNHSQSFDSLEDKCRFYWESNCDSDSDSESEASEPCEYLDVAFLDSKTEDAASISSFKTLRRESAISNLNDFSLLNRDLGLKTLNGTGDFDYSFDCSFPRMEESADFSCDFTYSFDESDSEDELNISDDSMDSFMNTKSFIDDSRDVTLSNVREEISESCVPSDREQEMII